jgi:5-methylcytosine-specific restriction enzyme subunit McrC
MFLLKPDLSLERHGKIVRILDTKWKVINTIAADAWRTKFGMSQADIYQVFAYGRKYLTDEPDKNVCLIYPKTRVFPKPLEHFEIEHDLRLHVLPFDIERGELLGLDGVSIS